MSQTELLSSPTDIWMDLVEAEANAGSILNVFLKQAGTARLDCVRRGLDAGGAQRMTALRVIPILPQADRQSLFPDLLRFSSSAHGLIQKFRDIILALPREWVIANIELTAEPLLTASNTEYQFEEYRRLLELYSQIGDRGLLERLARRALKHSDEDVREAGQTFLKRVKG